MRYIRDTYRGRFIHTVKGPYIPAEWEEQTEDLLETWCDRVFWIGLGEQPVQKGMRKPYYSEGIIQEHTGGTCSICRKTLRMHTSYPGELEAMDNDALYQEFRDAHWPDDYDSQFTVTGDLRLQLAVAEMETRLRGCGFLSAEEEG